MTRINTNVSALRAVSRLRVNNLDLGVRLERLATGLRINRAKDDPAGLIASEMLRSDIRTIGQAIENSQRVINVLTTAEGALNEISKLLLDVRGLLLSSANDGGLTTEEIAANQLEVDSILQSIDRISGTTTFGGKKLFDGSLSYSLSGVDAGGIASVTTHSARIPEGGRSTVVVQVTGSAQTAELSYAEPVLGTGLTSAVTFELGGALGINIVSFASGTSIADVATAINSLQAATGVSAALSVGGIRLNSIEYGSDQFVSVKSLAGTAFITTAVGDTTSDSGQDVTAIVNGQATDARGLRVDLRPAHLDTRLRLTAAAATAVSSTTYTITGGGARFQITPEVTLNGQVSIGIDSTSTGNLGNAVIGFLNSLGSGNPNSMTAQNFVAADRIVTEAISQVAVARGRLGGLQKDQIETNINSQEIQFENVTASESMIRDADLAVEVSRLTRAQILVQSTQLTLQIANQQPQAVLQLLG